jgi:hypothetical protein
MGFEAIKRRGVMEWIALFAKPKMVGLTVSVRKPFFSFKQFGVIRFPRLCTAIGKLNLNL